LNHTNLFAKNNLNEAEEITDIANTGVSAEKRKHDDENSREGSPPKKRVSRSRSRSKSLLSSNDIDELEFEDGKKEEAEEPEEADAKGEDVKLNQKCQVSIRPLWSSWNINPAFMLEETNKVIRIRLAELKSDFGHLNSKFTKYNSEHVMEMEAVKEREIWLTEQLKEAVRDKETEKMNWLREKEDFEMKLQRLEEEKQNMKMISDMLSCFEKPSAGVQTDGDDE